MALSKGEYERAMSQAAGSPVILSDDDYQRLVKGQLLSEKAMSAAKTRGANAGDDFADDDGPPLLRPDQPAEMYRPVVRGPDAPVSSSIGKIAPASVERSDGGWPSMDVDSAGVGQAMPPKFATKEWSGPDYGSAQLPYEVGELGGLGMNEPDRIYAKAPKGQYEFAPDTITAKPPSSKIDLLARSAFGAPAAAAKPKKKG